MNKKEQLIAYAKTQQWAYANIEGGSQLWLWVRMYLKFCCTGSKIGDACGVGYGSRQKYFKEQAGLVKRPKFPPYVLEMMNHGNTWEDTTLLLFLKEHLPNYNRDRVIRTGIIVSPRDARTAATPDAYLPDLDAIVEIKCRWPNAEKEPQTDGIHNYVTPYIPASHHMQVLHEMHCTGTSNAYYVTLGLTASTARSKRLWKELTPFRLTVEHYKFPQKFYDRIIWPKIEKFMNCVEKKQDPGRMANGSSKALKVLLQRHLQPIGGTKYYKGFCSLVTKPVGVPYTQ